MINQTAISRLAAIAALLLLVGAILVGCGGAAAPSAAPPTAAVQPTTAPAPSIAAATASPALPTSAPPPTVGSISSADVTQKTQPDGSISTSAQLSIEEYGIGELEFSYPVSMTTTEERATQLTIRPSQQLASLTPLPPKTPLPYAANLLPINDTISIYSVMYAQLSGMGVDVTNSVRRDIIQGEPTFWVWHIRPGQAGDFDYTLQISIPGSAKGRDGLLPIKAPLTFTIRVIDRTSPPEPSFWDKLLNNISANLTQGICGVLTALITSGIAGLLLKNWLDKRGQKQNPAN